MVDPYMQLDVDGTPELQYQQKERASRALMLIGDSRLSERKAENDQQSLNAEVTTFRSHLEEVLILSQHICKKQ